MSKSKHTPGEWIAHTTEWGDLSHGDLVGVRMSAPHRRERFTQISTGWLSDEEARANANLIAAAPEMYATLRFMRDLKRDSPLTDRILAIELIEAALNKAEKESVGD